MPSYFVEKRAKPGPEEVPERDITGFPSPAHDYAELPLNLHTYLVTNPPATFFVWAQGYSLAASGIGDGDLLIVDRSIPPRAGHIAVVVLDGEVLIRKLVKVGHKKLVVGDDPWSEVELNPHRDFVVWGVVKGVVRLLVGR